MNYKDLLKGMRFTKVSVPSGDVVSCVTVSQLARLCGRTADSIRELERKGKFPYAPLKLQGKTTALGVDLSQRLYPVELAKEVADYFWVNLRQGKKITPEDITAFFTIFKRYSYA